MGYFLPKDGFRVRFYSLQDVECPSDVMIWRKLGRLKKFNFSGLNSRILYNLGSSYGEKTPIMISGL